MSSTKLLADRHFGVVGAGLVGCLTALHLVRHGARITLVEKRPDLRATNLPGGRSVAMSLSDRGFHALHAVGLEDAVRARTHPKGHRCVHLPDGSLSRQAYGRGDQTLWTVNRKTLNCQLLDACQATGRVDLKFETLLTGLDTAAGRLTLQNPGDDSGNLRCDHIIGADGMNSQVRGALCAEGRAGEAVTTLDYRYFELVIPPAPGGAFALDAECVHIWPRPEGLFVALPNQGGSFTGTLFFAKAGDNLFHEGRSHSERAAGFAAAFPEVAALVPDYAATLEHNPPGDIRAVHCGPWHTGDRALLIGDACHAIVPFFAMGMNTGFEDCTVLDELIVAHHGDVARVFADFSARRKPRTDAIGDLSLRNFVSIGQSADPDYERRWKLERRLWELLPDDWMPLYPMIHFSRRPLDEVAAVNARQRGVLDALLAEAADESDDGTLIARTRGLLGG